MKAKFVAKGVSKLATIWTGSGRSFWRSMSIGTLKPGLYNVPSTKNREKLNQFEVIDEVVAKTPKVNAVDTITVNGFVYQRISR